MGVKFSNQQNAALLYPNLSTRVNNNNNTANNSLDEVKKPTKIVLLGTGEGGKSTIVKSLNYWYPVKRKYHGTTPTSTTSNSSHHQQVASNSVSGSSFMGTPPYIGSNSYSNTNNFLLQQGSVPTSLNSSLTNIHQNSPISSSVGSSYLNVNSVNLNGEFLGSVRNSSSIPKSPRTHSFDLGNSADLQCIIFDESLRDSIDLREDFSNSYRNPEYRRGFIYTIHRNTLLAMYGLVDGCINRYHTINVQLVDPHHNKKLIDGINAVLDAVSNMNKDNYWILDKSIAEMIKYLWYEIPQIQEMYEVGNDICFDYMESARYWFASIDRIAEYNYVPTINDILRIRMRTTGLVETLLHVPIKIRKTTSYYYYNCENEKVRLDVERPGQSSSDLHAINSFDYSMSMDGSFLEQPPSRSKKDYVVSYTIQDRFQDTKFTIDLDDILPQNTNLLEPIFENKIMKDAESSKTLLMYKPIRIVNMGSQRSERKKWINGFDEVSAVFFVVALSEYNQVLYEDRKTNRMMESLLVFNEIVNSTFFADVPVFLIFNKYDVFLEKIQHYDLSVAFGKEVPDHLKLNARNPFYQFATNYIQERLDSHQKKLEEDYDDIDETEYSEKKRKMSEKSLSYEFNNGSADSEDYSNFVLSQNEEKNIFDDLISKEEKRSLKKALAQTKKKSSIFGFLTPRAKKEEEHLAQQNPTNQRFYNQLNQKRKKVKDESIRAPSVLGKAIENESKASCSSLRTMSINFNPNRLSDDNLLRQIMSQNHSNCNVRGLQQTSTTNVGAEEEDNTENDVLDDEADTEWTVYEEREERVMIDLPSEALIYVCMFLDPIDLCSLSEVNYDFYRLSTSDIVWRSVCLRYQEDIDENIIISKYALYMQEDADEKILISFASAVNDDSQVSNNNRRVFAKGVYKYWYEFGQSFIKRNIDFIVSKFMEQTTRKDIKIHITTAIDLDSLKPIMDSTFNRIIKHVAEQKD